MSYFPYYVGYAVMFIVLLKRMDTVVELLSDIRDELRKK